MMTKAISIFDVRPDRGGKTLNRETVKALADSIREVGQLNPITVCEDGEKYTLVSGRHRIAAVALLDSHTIDASIVTMAEADQQIATLDENLVRNTLTAMERGEQLADRKRLYEAKHPGTRWGGAPGKSGGGKKAKDGKKPSFADDTATKTGLHKRTVQRDVEIAESIPEDVREAIRDTPLANSQTDLRAMARLSEDDQRAVIAEADLSDKQAVRTSIKRRQSAPEPEPEPEQETKRNRITIEVTVFGILTAVAYLDRAERLDLIEQIKDMDA